MRAAWGAAWQHLLWLNACVINDVLQFFPINQLHAAQSGELEQRGREPIEME